MQALDLAFILSWSAYSLADLESIVLTVQPIKGKAQISQGLSRPLLKLKVGLNFGEAVDKTVHPLEKHYI